MHRTAHAVSTKKSGKRYLGLSFEQYELILLAITGAAAICFFVQAFFFLPVVSDNMYPESAGVFSALHWANGLPLYEDFRKPPYLLTSFPPLWYMSLGLAAKAGFNNIDSLTLVGRLMSLCSLAGIAVLAFVWNIKLGFSQRSALLAPALYLSFPILVPWAITARPDLPALFFSLLAIYCMGLERGTTGTVTSAIFATIAFLIRHNSVAAPVAIVLWLAYRKRWKQAALFCCVWWVIVASGILLFQYSSHGMFLLNLGGAKFGSLALTYVRDVVLRLLISPESGFAVALFALGTFGAISAFAEPKSREKLLGFYLIASLGFAILGSAAAGAAGNHFVEPALALAVLSPFALGRLKEGWAPDSPAATLALVITALLLLPSLDVQRWNAMHKRPDDMRSLANLVQGKRVFTDIPYVGARSSSPQFLDPASLTYALRTPGIWSTSGFVKQLNERYYDIAVLSESPTQHYDPAARYPRYPHLGGDIRTAIVQNYELCVESNGTYIYILVSVDSNSACALVKNRLPASLASSGKNLPN